MEQSFPHGTELSQWDGGFLTSDLSIFNSKFKIILNSKFFCTFKIFYINLHRNNIKTISQLWNTKISKFLSLERSSMAF